ncbi:Copia protein [Trachymyrmex zeteki]|uniref:Copia protein n=1 Tax=Mycetomoellerius zeteki TaxID=64791 RepID=A0A151WHI9_9HYME|nr:Copia protein [Trachymyrmex zeteki]
MEDCKEISTPLSVGTKLSTKIEDITDSDENFPYRQLLGALMYVAVGTRSDIAYAVSALSQFNNDYDKTHWIAAKRVLRYLKGTIDHKLIYRKDENRLDTWTRFEAYFAKQDGQYYLNGLKGWEHRWKKCIDLKGDYVEK